MDIFIVNAAKAKEIQSELIEEFVMKSFVNEEKKQIHGFSYLMLDRILKEVYGIENRSLLFKNGKPYLQIGDKQFSLSHSGKYIVFVFSAFQCGVDIEKIKDREYKKISARMGFESSTLDEFYVNWTKYEAEYKLEGKAASVYNFKIPDYVITAVSENKDEIYTVYYNQ